MFIKRSALFIPLAIYSCLCWSQIQTKGLPASFKTPNVFSTDIPQVYMPLFDMEALLIEDSINDQIKDIPWRFGYNHTTNFNPKNSGIWEDVGKGDKVWRLKITSKKALTINLAFEDFSLPEGASLFIYNEIGDNIIGALTSKNNKKTKELGTNIINGETVILEYYEPAQVAGQGQFTVSQVTHGYRKVQDVINFHRGFGDSGSCNNNVACPEGAPWANQIRSIAAVIVNGNSVCSGSLINNACGNTLPYFLTANHCVNSSVATWVFRFNYESANCTPSQDGVTSQTISGATLLASNSASDFALLELSVEPPPSYNVYYSGWDRSGNVPTSTVAIHHPRGDVKKISFDNDSPSLADWGSPVAQTWHISTWESGTTEPASSGGPLFNQDGRVIGQLFGGNASCSSNIDDYFGRFATSWDAGGSAANQLVNWLDACGSGDLLADGYDPNQPSVALDASLLVVNNPLNGSEICNNLITPFFSIKNNGTDSITSYTINYQIDGNTVNDTIWTGLLQTNEIDSFFLPSLSFNSGQHEIKIWVSAPNNSVDLNSNNDTLRTIFNILDPFTADLPIEEGFENGVFPPVNWSVNNPDNQVTWELEDGLGAFGASNNCVKLDAFSTNASGSRDQLHLPFLDFTFNDSIQLNFSVAYAAFNALFNDSLLLKVSVDCGLSWQTLYAKGGNNLSTNGGNFVPSRFTPDSTEWREETVWLNSFKGIDNVLIAFENYNGFGNVIYLDDINISAFITSVDEAINEMNLINIFPNPTDGKSTITIGIEKWDKIEVYSSIGKLIEEKIVKSLNESSNVVLDFNDYVSGLYFVVVKQGNKKFVKKLIVK